MISRYFAAPTPRIIAHRGGLIPAAGSDDPATAEPENTLAAFGRAAALGLTHVETDVHASRDGVAVISHDSDLVRLAGRPDRIGSLTLAELEAVDLGRGSSYTSLAAALDAFPGLHVNIDIKADAAATATAHAVRSTASADRVLVTSFSAQRRRRAVREMPGVATSASSSEIAGAVLAMNVARSPALFRSALRLVDAVQIPEHWHGVMILTPRLINACHSVGVEVHVWTVNEPVDMLRLLRLGVDGLVTDRPDLALWTLESGDERPVDEPSP